MEAYYDRHARQCGDWWLGTGLRLADVRETEIRDPDGNRLRIGTPVSP